MYEVYALKYAERTVPSCQFFYREPSHDPVTLHYYVWLILGGPHPVVVDTGFCEDDAAQRGIERYVSPAEMVRRLGVRPDEIPMGLVTHLHYDHWAGHTLFPGTEFWVQREELAFWTGPDLRHEVFHHLANVGSLGRLPLLGAGARLHAIEGDREVLSGLRVHRVGGHTAGLQIVSVQTARGPVVLTSDAAHFYRNVERRQPVQLITSLPEMMLAFETIEALAGPSRLVVTGHDPDVARRFTVVEPGIVRIA